MVVLEEPTVCGVFETASKEFTECRGSEGTVTKFEMQLGHRQLGDATQT